MDSKMDQHWEYKIEVLSEWLGLLRITKENTSERTTEYIDNMSIVLAVYNEIAQVIIVMACLDTNNFLFLLSIFLDFIFLLFDFLFEFLYGWWRGMWYYSHMTCDMMWGHKPRTLKKNLEE